MIKRTIHKSIKIKDLFDKLKIQDVEHATYIPNFTLKVLTPYGYENIKNLFRTEKQKSVTIYFSNNKTLECSWHHRLMVNGTWTKIKDINKDDIIETQTGVTTIKSTKEKRNDKILYDISVENVHCYYSNKILSHNSWILVALGLLAASQGKHVAHYTLELSEGMIAQRYYSVLTGIAAHALPYNLDEVKTKLQNIIKKKGSLIIKGYPTKGASINTFRAHLERLKTIENAPDFVVLDYGDLIKPIGYHKEKRLELANIYEELRGLAGEFNLPLWTATQANRSGAEGNIITGEQVSEDYSKIMISDFLMSIHRKVEDKVSKTARTFIVKNRFGPDGLTFPTKFDTNNGHINIFEEQSVQGQQTRKDMGENGKNLKKM